MEHTGNGGGTLVVGSCAVTWNDTTLVGTGPEFGPLSICKVSTMEQNYFSLVCNSKALVCCMLFYYLALFRG